MYVKKKKKQPWRHRQTNEGKARVRGSWYQSSINAMIHSLASIRVTPTKRTCVGGDKGYFGASRGFLICYWMKVRHWWCHPGSSSSPSSTMTLSKELVPEQLPGGHYSLLWYLIVINAEYHSYCRALTCILYSEECKAWDSHFISRSTFWPYSWMQFEKASTAHQCPWNICCFWLPKIMKQHGFFLK